MRNFILILISVALLFVGCSRKNNSGSATSINITDYSGRNISLEKPAEKIIAMADNAFLIIKQLDALNKVVGLDSKTKGYLDLYPISETDSKLQDLPDVGKTKNPNYELILSLAPDLILFKGNRDAAETMQSKTGIPVISIISKTGYDFDIYNLIGIVLGKQKEATTIINELTTKKEYLENLLTSVPANEKKSAYIVVQNKKDNFFKTQRNSLSLDLAAVQNIAANAGKVDEWGFAEISQEEFLSWDPDFIFLDYPTTQNSITKQKLFENETYHFLQAIQNKEIYHTHSFSVPKDYVYVIAEAYYYARVAYPHILSENDYREAINSIFKHTYKIDNYYEQWKISLQ